ncbi:MAG: DUF6541 family protein [Umezawaea sp.]
MTFSDATLLLVALIAVVLPGAALLFALGVRRLLWTVGLAPAASVGVATIVGMVCGLVGLPYGGWALGAAVVVLLVVAAVRAREAVEGRGLPRVRGRVGPIAAGGAVLLLAVLYGLRTWMSGMGGTLTSIPQEHDTILHTELVAYIMRTGRGAAWQLLPVDLLSGSPVSYYPSGMHLLAAATGDVVGGPIAGLNAVTVVLLGVCLVLSAAALTFVAAKQARLGVPASLTAAGIAGLVAVGLNAPTITFATQGGLLPNAAALCLAPGVIAVLLDLRERDWSAAVAIAVGCLGLLALHPSAAMTVGLTLVVWWIGRAFDRGGLALLRAQAAPTAVAVAVAGVLAAPLLILLTTVSTRTASFPPDVGAVPLSVALKQTLALPFTGYLPEYNGQWQVAALALTALGVAAVLVSRRALGPMVAAAVWALITIGMWVSPGTGPDAVITGFYYNSILRVRSHVDLLVPVLAGLGVVITSVIVVRGLRRVSSGRFARRPVHLVVALSVVVAAVYALVPGLSYLRVSAHYLASRYGAPDLNRVGPHDQDGFDFLDGRVKPGERVMNSANDGSTYLYVEKGIPVVNTIALGFAQAPYTYQLLERFDTYPTDAEIREEVVDLNITWVYVDTDPPTIGASGSPENWAGGGGFTSAPGLDSLDGLPGLTEEFRSGPVRVYRLDLDEVKEMG